MWGKDRRTNRPPEVVHQSDQLRAEARAALDKDTPFILFWLEPDGGMRQVGDQTLLTGEQMMMFLATVGQMIQTTMSSMMLAASLSQDDSDDDES